MTYFPAAVQASAAMFAHAAVQEYAEHAMLLLADAIHVCAAILIALAAGRAAVRSVVLFFRRGAPKSATEEVRLRLGRWLVLALEFQVAADILRTAVAPTWSEIGQLAAIVVLRTVLNYALQWEISRSPAEPAPTAAGSADSDRRPL